MARSRFFLRSASAAAAFGIVIPLLGACGGHVVSLGTNGSQLRSVDPSTVKGSAAACPAGYAHPNVCCESSQGAAPQCGAYEQHPFQACESGWTTYPNPLTCCSLKNDQDCIDTPTDAGAPVPPSYGCGYVCPPGWYPDPNAPPPTPESGSCCTKDPKTGQEECEGWASASPGVPVMVNGTGGGDPSGPPCEVGIVDAGVAPSPSPPAPIDAGPAPDSGVVDASDDVTAPPPPPPFDGGTCPPVVVDAGPPEGYDGGITSLCGECPPGWNADPSAPDLCCQIDPSGIEECFSQATGPIGGPLPPPATDAGVPTPVTIDAGVAPTPMACGGNESSCSCQDTTSDGHEDVLDCSIDSKGNATCFCTRDGKSLGQLPPQGGLCSDTKALEAAFQTCFGPNG
jgi:hypothetical protein